MATVYKFNVECVSAFCAYPPEFVEKLIADALTNYESPETGLKLESITVKEV